MMNNITITSTLRADSGTTLSTCELLIADQLDCFLQQEVLSYFSHSIDEIVRSRVGRETLHYRFDLDTDKVALFLLAMHQAQLKILTKNRQMGMHLRYAYQ